MPATPPRPTNLTTLPRTLLRTTVPKPNQDSDCLVCWEPLADTPTIEHVGTAVLPGCGRRFHEECLHTYYLEADQQDHEGLLCLLCRAVIVGHFGENPWSANNLFTRIRNGTDTLQLWWRQWHAVVQRMYIGASPHSVCAVFQAALPNENPEPPARDHGQVGRCIRNH